MGAGQGREVVVTARDLDVLRDLYKYRYLSVSQIQRLHFPSLQTTYRRLRALAALKCIAGFIAPHITEHIYHLDRGGAELVAGALGINFSDLKWRAVNREPKDYYFLRHFLAINDFRILLTQGCGREEMTLLGFIPEYFGAKDAGDVARYIKDVVCDVNNKAERISHTPDAVFALEKRSTPALFFLEIDRGTEVVGREDKGVLKCVRFYLSLLASGQYQRYRNDFGCEAFKGFRALIVTTTDARVANIRQAITGLSIPAKAKQFIWLTHTDRLQSAGIFQPIWLSGDEHDSAVYRIG
jgi:hypothetical protein